MKKNIVLIILAVIIFVGGFFAGMEYKAYQIRTALEQAFKPTNTTATNPSPAATSGSVVQQVKNEGDKITNVKIGDLVTLATMTYKVNSVDETQTLSASYSSPKTADAGTKFVVINMDITNTTSSQFDLSPDDTFVLVDNKNREFKTYSDSIGALDNELTYKTLPPSVTQTGVLIYEVPTDATKYGILALKAGTKQGYMVVLK